MPWSSTRTTRSRPAGLRDHKLLHASRYACEALERRLQLTAGGTFADAAAYVESGGVPSNWNSAVGRFNNDSYPDIVVAVTGIGYPFPKSTMSVLLGSANGTFTLAYTIQLDYANSFPRLQTGDLNNDGYSDVVMEPDSRYSSDKSLYVVLGLNNGHLGI